MDLMQDNLNNIIRSQRFKSDDIRYIIYQILNALNYLHKCGVIHGDLKPNDIGINRDFHIKIIDLNVERPRDKDYVLTKWWVCAVAWNQLIIQALLTEPYILGIKHQNSYSAGRKSKRRSTYGALDAF